GFSATWVRPGAAPDDTTPDPDDGSAPAYEPEVRELMARRCTSCHVAGGSRANSPLTTYAEVRLYGDTVVLRSANKTMPPPGGTPFTDEEIKILTDWKNAGYPEAKSANPQTTNPGGITPGGTPA